MSDFADIKRRMDALAKPAAETPPEWLDVWRDEIGFAKRAEPPTGNEIDNERDGRASGEGAVH